VNRHQAQIYRVMAEHTASTIEDALRLQAQHQTIAREMEALGLSAARYWLLILMRMRTLTAPSSGGTG
jgi:hypothetical protein